MTITAISVVPLLTGPSPGDAALCGSCGSYGRSSTSAEGKALTSHFISPWWGGCAHDPAGV